MIRPSTVPVKRPSWRSSQPESAVPCCHRWKSSNVVRQVPLTEPACTGARPLKARRLAPRRNDGPGSPSYLASGFGNGVEEAILLPLSGSVRALSGSISKRILYLGSPTQ